MTVSAPSTLRSRKGARFRRIFLEQLEDRSLLAAIITVNSTLDANSRDSVLTLREAILISNRTLSLASLTPAEIAQVIGTPTSSDTDTIAFNIPGSGVRTIAPTSSLSLSDPAIIDGFTQPGASPNTNGPELGDNSVHLIELSGINGGSTTHGLRLDNVSGATIRGLVINRFVQDGISINNGSNNKVEGNFIGTDASGTIALPMANDGVGIFALTVSANNVIGGASPASRNLISGNNIFGVNLFAASSGSIQNTIIQGNFIGTDASGTLPLANSRGINAEAYVTGTIIGGSNPGEGNLVSGNSASGIELGGGQNICTGAGLTNGPSSGNVIRGNKIGTDVTGAKPLGNVMDGISIGYESPSTNAIGGTGAGDGNIIAFNGLHGVGILRSTTSILSNSIFSNAQLGIHLGITGCAVTPNDPLDGDSGPNNLQNYPVLNTAGAAGSSLTLSYSVPSATAYSSYPLRVEFFKADDNGQEGQTLLGFDTYQAAEAGTSKTIAFTAAAAIAAGDKIVATATDNAGNTSEFSASITVQSTCSTVVLNTNDAGAGSLRDAINYANTTPGTDTICFNIPGAGVHTISPLSALPTITDPVIIDGYTQPGASPNTYAIDDPDPAKRAFNGKLLIQLDGGRAGGANGFGNANGLKITAGGSTVRGLVITRFKGSDTAVSGNGILLETGGGNVVEGNFLGIDATGATSQGNISGIRIAKSSANNRMGGTTPEARNVVSGNVSSGIEFSFVQGNVVQGNLIGTDATGRFAVPNQTGVWPVGANTIGGTTSAARNIISGNSTGVFLFGGNGGAIIAGNWIGTDITGVAALGNLTGLSIDLASSNTIGGTSNGAGNTIAFNTREGVLMQTDSRGASLSNAVLGNSIFKNGNLGIDLGGTSASGGDGPTPNDVGDADTGPNKLQNFPQLSAASLAGTLSLQYAIPTMALNAAYPLRVEFFKADSDGQEGQTFLGFDTYTAAEAGTTKTFSFTPTSSLRGGDKIVATATDNDGNTSEFGPPATVVGTGNPPTAINDTATASEDSPLNIAAPGILANDTDGDPNDTKTVVAVNAQLANVGTQITLASGALLTVQSSGSVTYDPHGKFDSLRTGQTATDSFTYTMADSQGATSSATVTITIQGANDPPVAVNDSASVGENGLLTVLAAGLLANDTDVDAGDTRTIVAINDQISAVGSQISLPSGALLKVQSNGSYTYDPNGQFESLATGQSATDSFTYRVVDGQGATSTATVTIIVTGANDPPTAVNDAAMTDEDHVLELTAPGLLANDADVDNGDTISVVAANGLTNAVGIQITLASGGLLRVNADGSVHYDPNGSFEWLTVGHTASDSFNYTIADSQGVKRTAIASITILGENDAPVAAHDMASTAEDDVLIVPADGVLDNDTDPDDGDTRLVVAINGQASFVGVPVILPSGALLTAQDNGSFSYDPNGKFESLADGQTTTDSFAYTMRDSQGATSSAPVTITIVGSNDEPLAADDSVATGEDAVLVVGASGVLDNDGDIDFGDSKVVVSVLDQAALVGAPITLPSGALLTVRADGSYRYDPNGAFESLADGEIATDSFTYTMSDGQGAASSATALITILGADDAPVAVDDSATTGANQVLQVEAAGLLANDTDIDDGDTKAIIAVNGVQADVAAPTTLTSGALLTVQADGSYRYDPNGAFESLAAGATAVDYFTYTVADRAGATSTAMVAITIQGDNDAPVTTDDTFQATEDQALLVAAPGVLKNDTDVDLDKLTAAIDSQPGHGTLDLHADGSFRYVPAPNYNGPDCFTYHAGDGSATSTIVTVNLNVRAVNDPPLAGNDTFSAVEDTPLSAIAPGLLANDSDVDSSGLTTISADGPMHGKLVLHPNGSFIYTPDSNYNGPDSFTYRVSDGQSLSNLAMASLTIAPVNDTPAVSLGPDTTLNEGSLLSSLGSFADPDSGDSWTAMVDYGDGSGIEPLALAADKSFQLSHQYLENGTYHVAVTVQDAAHATGTSSLQALVNNVAPQNLAWSGPLLGARNQALQFAGSFGDPGLLDTQTASIDWGDGTTGAASLTGGGGLWQVNASHVFSAGGFYPVTLKVTDDDGGLSTATSTVMIVGARLNHGTLEIVGTSQTDTIQIAPSRNNLTISGKLGGANFNQSFLVYGVQRIVAVLGDGNDSLTVSPKIKASLLVVGGAGNDKIKAGGGAAVLIGGVGQDQLTGGAKSDLLIAGPTAYDNNPTALAAILAEWGSSRPLAARSANLRAGNGFLLQAAGVHLAASDTVFSDSDIDTLTGGSDLDWFFFDASKDKVKDKATGELLS